MTKSDFIDWKNQEITRTVFQVIKHEIAQLENQISRSAGQDPGWDRYRSGVLRGMERLLEVDFDEGGDDENVETLWA